MNDSWIYEPVTFLTDIILASVSLYCGLWIGKLYWQKYHLFHFHLSWALYMLALGAFLGGIYHGFFPNSPTLLGDLIWKMTLLAIGLTLIFFLLASISAVVSYEVYIVIRWIPLLAFLVYAFLIWRYSDYTHAVRFYVPAVLFVFIMMVYIYVRTKDAGAGNIILGLIISFLGAVLWKSELSLHVYFNHNDLYHAIQTVGLWSIFRGGLAIKNILN